MVDNKDKPKNRFRSFLDTLGEGCVSLGCGFPILFGMIGTGTIVYLIS